ncbi:MAG: hypothetical protein REH83_03295 [Rickettsiella sp.]|nr:hypothetical protein [Rickettsiella sp.]
MALEKLYKQKSLRVKFFAFLSFMRLLVLIAKRIISNLKNFIHLPGYAFGILNYVLHFLRAFLRLVNYLFNTKNKNLGETRKFIFSFFKVIIAIVGLLMLPTLTTSIVMSLFAYNAVKLIDSTLVLFVSFFKHSKIDKASLEDRWRREQYWDNILKHMSISALVVPVTLATAFVFPGMGLMVWISAYIIIPFAIIVASLITVAAITYLCGLIYQRFQVNNTTLQAEYDANIKKISLLIGVCLLSFACVAIAVCLPVIAIGIVSALGMVATSIYILMLCYQHRQISDEHLRAMHTTKIKKLVFFLLLAVVLLPLTFCFLPTLLAGPAFLFTTLNSIDAIKSTYDYFDTTKIGELKPASLTAKNSLEATSNNDYYYRKNRILYLNPNNVQANELFLSKEALIKLLEFRYKQAAFGEKDKLEIKKSGIINDIASVMSNKGSDDELINTLIQSIIGINEDAQKLNSTKALKASSVIEKIADLEEDLAELLDHMAYPIERENKNNFLMELWFAFKMKNFNNIEADVFPQSFFKHTSDSVDFRSACRAANEIKQEKMLQTSFSM